MTTTVGTPGAANTTTPGRAWASLILGILIFLVPFATGTTSANGSQSFAYNDYVVGVVVFVLAAISIWAARNNLAVLAWLEGINVLLGLWTIAAPFVFATGNGGAMTANVILGIILVIVAAWDSYVGMSGREGRMTRRGRAV
jgi:hypothetical protein